MPLDSDKVTVIIPVWNSGKWIPGCLEALSKQTYTNFSLLIIDNGSEDGSVVNLNKPGGINNLEIVSFEQNRGFAAAVNTGISKARTEYVVLLNIDTLPEPEWLERLVEAMDQAPVDVTSLASKMLLMENPDLVDSAGDRLSWYGSAFKRGHGEEAVKFEKQEYVFSACAGAALYRRSLFNEIGYFDERFVSYFEDIDFGFREKLAGYKCMFVPAAKVIHKGHSAGVAGSYYVFLMTRNRLLTFVKNIPASALLSHLYQILYGQLYFLLVYKKPLASLRGYLSAFAKLQGVLEERRAILSKRREKGVELDSILESTLGEPGFVEILRRKFV